MHIVRIATVYDPDVKALPPEFRSALTKQDVKAIRTGPSYFGQIAKADSPRWLRKVLRHCAEGPYELQFYSSGDAPYRLYFRFCWGGEPGISLPRPVRLRPDVPGFLRNVYSVIGSFRENGFDMAGGLYSADGLVPLSMIPVWVEPGGPIDPATAIPFLETFSGSLLCYLVNGGGGAWLEDCTFRPVKNLEGEVTHYFEALLKGTRI